MKPQRNSKYLAWIRKQPCLVCGTRWRIEASHTGPRGLGQKSSDRSAIPLCAKHHRTCDSSYHRPGPRKFAQLLTLDIPAVVRKPNLKPGVRVRSGVFAAHLEAHEYVLAKTEPGIQPAV